MKKKIAIIGSVLVLAAGAAVAIYMTVRPGDVTMTMGGGTVIISTVSRGDLRQVVTANGNVELERVEPVYSSAEGETRLRVAEVLVEVGDQVEEGQTIVTYDIEEALNELNRQINRSQINLENQRLSLQTQTLGPTPQDQRSLREQIYSAQEGIVRAEESIIERRNDIVTANNDIVNANNRINDQRQMLENARRAYDQAKSEVEVNSRILALGGITQHTFNEIVQAADNRRVELESAEIDLANRLLELENSRNALEASERALESAERALESAERSLESAEINYSLTVDPLSSESARLQHAQAVNSLALMQHDHEALLEQRERLISETVSHIGGTVMEVEVTVGAQVTGQSKLVDIADFSNLIVTAQIREVDAPQVFVGQSVTMTSAGLAGKVYNGTVTRVSPTAISRQAQTGTEIVVPIEISVDNPDDQLRPGFSVDIEIVLVESLDTVNISLMSVMQDFETGQEYVMVNENGILRRRYITRGITTALDVEILEGLEEGDVIVLTPTPMMQDGDSLPEDAIEAGFPMGMDAVPGGGGGVIRIN